jgi:hypothetical protein
MRLLAWSASVSKTPMPDIDQASSHAIGAERRCMSVPTGNTP